VKNIENIKSHIALFLLRDCFWIPKLNYFLRCCPFWKIKNYCEAFDEKIQSTLKQILNIKLSSNSWNQVSLPLDFGGLGIRIDRRTLSGSWSYYWQAKTVIERYFHICWRKQKTKKCHKNILSVSNFS
jgi:hypothetical protein